MGISTPQKPNQQTPVRLAVEASRYARNIPPWLNQNNPLPKEASPFDVGATAANTACMQLLVRMQTPSVQLTA